MKKRILPLFIISVISASCLFGCKKEEIEDMTQEDDSLPVDIISVEQGTLLIPETFMGNVLAERELKIYPKTSGEVLNVNVRAGDYVNAGDVLFRLNDSFAQLDLKTAQSTLNKTQAEVKKSEGSDEVLAQQKEWQALENENSKIADSSYSLTTANEDYDRQRHYLSEAKDKEDIAYKDYQKAANKYDKANWIMEAYEKLKAVEPAFLQMSLDQAANAAANPETGPSQEHIDQAKVLYGKLWGNEDERLFPSDVTSGGVASLKATMDTQFSKYSELRSAREGQEDKVTSAKRTVDKADKALQDEYTSYRQSVDNMLVKDIAGLEDQKRINQIDINASSIGVEKAKKNLEQYTVTSPISGYIGKVNIKEYETVSTGTEAVLISNTDSMTIEFSVTEKVRNNLSLGQDVSVEKDDIQTAGTIFEIAESADTQTGLFLIKAAISGSTGIMAGTKVTVTLNSYIDSGFIIPNDAVYHSAGQSYVFVAENGKAVRKDVTTGLFDTDRIVISEGLNAGDHVITSWSSELKEGTRLKENQVKNPVVTNGMFDADKNTGAKNTAPEAKEDTDPLSEAADEQVTDSLEGGNSVSTDQTKVRATTTVFVRSAPNTDDNGNKLGKAKPGDEFVRTGEENGWTRVVYNDSEAYIKSDYLTLVNDTGEAE